MLRVLFLKFDKSIHCALQKHIDSLANDESYKQTQTNTPRKYTKQNQQQHSDAELERSKHAHPNKQTKQNKQTSKQTNTSQTKTN